MANTQAKRDGNRVAVALGEGDSNETLPISLDTATGRVLITNTAVVAAGGESVPTAGKTDGNRIGVIYGLSDDGNDTLIPIAVDNRNGLIYCDILAE